MKKTTDTTTQLGVDPIWRLILRFSLPSIISMTVASFYYLVDRVFIGRYVGEVALGGLTVAYPFTMILFAFNALFAIGGSALISIQFGQKKEDEAQQVFGNMVTLLMVSTLFFVSISLIFVVPILKLMGATKSILPYAIPYMRIVLLGLLVQMPSFAMASLARVEGKPRLAMTTQLIAGVSNIVLDYIFVVVFHWGVQGAAGATLVGQAIGFTILLFHFFIRKRSLLHFHARNLLLRFGIVKQICAIGSSNFFTQLGTSVSSVFLIASLGRYGGDAAISSMGALTSLISLVMMPLFGLQQGVGPIVGYNHGMKQNARVRRTVLLGIIGGSIFSVFVFLLMELFPAVFASFFIDPTSATIELCAHAIRINVATLPFLSILIIGASYFQSTAQALKAFVLSVSRTVIFLIPAILILPPFFKLDGVWAAQPVADAMSTLLAVILISHSLISMKKSESI
ncbi:MATE family efflux transporter [Lachnospiraceae bacterium ZAX-1]